MSCTMNYFWNDTFLQLIVTMITSIMMETMYLCNAFISEIGSYDVASYISHET